ncbi:MAG: methyl-accepting chemotaxis protein [Campylobacterota bacterium]
MGFVKSGNSETSKPQEAQGGAKVDSIAAKKRRKTLARQQHISENLLTSSDSLSGKIQDAVSAIEELKSSMEEISSASEENAGAAEQSLHSIKSINDATTNIFENTKDIVTKVELATKSVQTATDNTLKSGERMQRSAQGAEKMGKKSVELKQASDRIEQAVGIIAKVADQTNLLALNAAIEASRAKEHGKGFAVVAEETRGLAMVSSEQAERTRDIVNKVQNDIEGVEKNIASVGGQVKDAYGVSSEAIEVAKDMSKNITQLFDYYQNYIVELEALKKDIDTVQEGSEAVASSAEQQSSAVAQATSAIEMQAAAINQTEQAVQGLLDLSEELKHSTDINKDAEEVASTAEQLSSAVEQIQRSMSEVVGALSQINEAASDAEENADTNVERYMKNLDIAKKNTEEAEKLKELMASINESLDMILKSLTSMKDAMLHCVEEGEFTTKTMVDVEANSKTIEKILRKIENTVIQTNSLAVSGSIEAARAGEYGKGFAVVSGDIRNLAQDAGNNLEKIADIIDGINQKVAEVTFDWKADADAQREEAIILGNLIIDIEGVVNYSKEVSGMMHEIAEKNASNLSAMEEGAEGAKQVKESAQLSKNNSSEAKQAADMILKTVDEMSEMIEEVAVLADELQQG